MLRCACAVRAWAATPLTPWSAEVLVFTWADGNTVYNRWAVVGLETYYRLNIFRETYRCMPGLHAKPRHVRWCHPASGKAANIRDVYCMHVAVVDVFKTTIAIARRAIDYCIIFHFNFGTEGLPIYSKY